MRFSNILRILATALSLLALACDALGRGHTPEYFTTAAVWFAIAELSDIKAKLNSIAAASNRTGKEAEE